MSVQPITDATFQNEIPAGTVLVDFCKDGQVVNPLVGVQPKDRLKAAIEQV